MKSLISLAIATSIAFSSAATADFADYPAQAIGELMQSVPRDDNEYLCKPGDTYFETGAVVAKSRMLCSGSSRSLDGERQRFLKLYFQSRGQMHFAELFKDELLCREGVNEYWLPIQQNLVPHWNREVSPGKPVDLFVMYVGTFRSEVSKLVSMFLINEFSLPSEMTER